MKYLTMTFYCDNAAFDDDANEEATRVLLEVAAKLKCGTNSAAIFDSNGNKIGQFTFVAV